MSPTLRVYHPSSSEKREMAELLLEGLGSMADGLTIEVKSAYYGPGGEWKADHLSVLKNGQDFALKEESALVAKLRHLMVRVVSLPVRGEEKFRPRTVALGVTSVPVMDADKSIT